jgi:phospholipase/lecithinase/hemolysin
MKNLRQGLLAAAAMAALLAGCGGGGDGDQTPRVKYAKLVTFGDSLSDVGTYGVGVVASMGGGKYTVNGSTAKNWTELLAAQAKVTAPCPAQTGLNSVASLGGPVPVVNHSGCYSYAQGGARVTDPTGPGNANLLALGDASGALGQLTVPVVTQIGNHLAATGGSFAADDLVTVLAGANDLFMQVNVVNATAQAGGDANAAAAAAVQAMGVAGAQLAGYVQQLILAKGAQHVVVVNIPDVSLTPMAVAAGASSQALIKTMTSTFNDQLKALATLPNVLLVDSFTAIQQQVANPAQFGVTNATTPACDLTGKLAQLPTSLVCTSATLIAGDVSHYYFADSVHPTPYGYQLLAGLVTDQLLKKGWL